MEGRGRKNTVILPGIKSTLENPYGVNATSGNRSWEISCRDDPESEATILVSLAVLGISANLLLMLLIVMRGRFSRWSHALLFHQSVVDFLRSCILIPLSVSILGCQAIHSCNILETSFLLLVTASTINLLTTVMSDVPVLPDEDDEDALPMLLDSPQCVAFGIFVIWFASITINLGPTFLSGTMAANINHKPREPSCPLVQGPFRHYIINFLWIFVNLICIVLTIYHLVKLYRDYTHPSADTVRVATLVTSIVSTDSNTSEVSSTSDLPQLQQHQQAPPPPGTAAASSDLDSFSLSGGDTVMAAADPVKVQKYLSKIEREGTERVKMFLVITTAYLIFWGPLFLVTLFNWDWEYEDAKQSMAHEVTLHVAFVHAFVNPSLLMVLHRGIRQAGIDLVCCSWRKIYKRNKNLNNRNRMRDPSETFHKKNHLI